MIPIHEGNYPAISVPGGMDKTDLAVLEVDPNPFTGENGQISLIHGTPSWTVTMLGNRDKAETG